MAFNPFAFIRLAGLFPGFTGLASTALSSVAVRFGTTAVASKLAVSILRTAGYILNRSPVTLGIPLANTPAGRLVTGPPTFLNPLGFPGINSFLAGFAYRDNEELADGWLSFFGDLIFSEVPLVETSTEKAIKALRRGDLQTFGAEAADAVAADIGLAALAAFFRGIESSEADLQAVGFPLAASPASIVFGGVVAAVRFLDSAFTAIGRGLGGLLEPPDPPETGPDPPSFRDIDTALKTALREAAKGLPTTEDEVREVGRTFNRFRQFLPDLARIIDLLKRTRA